MVFSFKNILAFLLVGICLSGSSCSKQKPEPAAKVEPDKKPVVDGIRIGWDYSTITKVAPKSDRSSGYYGYARMIQLHDGRLACVYEASPGNIELVFSNDLGTTWGNPKIVFETKNNISMAVPEIIELSDNSILVACNPRPREPFTDNRKFAIKVRKSTDNGQTWQPEKIIYEAKSTFDNGCWEPSFVQLENGETQLFFANEGVYTSSNEQNISMFKSTDLGETWSNEPVIVGFRSNHRDGMPVPLLLPIKGELLVAIEDNKTGEFKPTIYREKISNNWADGTITDNDSRREYQPLTDPLPSTTYAGAPYLARLGNGEVLLSYQTNLDRNNEWAQSAMAVEIGDNSGKNFDRRSFPFQIPLSKSGLWNSITVIEGNTPVAVTSTNAFSSNSTEVWMIKGHVIPAFNLPTGTANIDAETDDNCWKSDWPYFVGQKSTTKLKASLCADENNLYLVAVVEDAEIISNGSADKIVFQIDIERKGYVAPHVGIYAFHLGADGSLKIMEGDYGDWKEIDDKNLMIHQTQKNDKSHQIEMAIPKSFFGGKWSTGKTVGVNFTLKNETKTEEDITTNDAQKPFTWCPLHI